MNKKTVGKVFSIIKKALSKDAEKLQVTFKGMKRVPEMQPIKGEIAKTAIKKAKAGVGDADIVKLGEVLEQTVVEKTKYVSGQHTAIKDAFEKSGKIVDDIAHHIDDDAVKLLKQNPKEFYAEHLQGAMYDKARNSVYRELETDYMASNISMYGAKYNEVVKPLVEKAHSLQKRVEIQNQFRRSAINQKKIGMAGTWVEKFNNETTSAYHKINAFYAMAKRKGNVPLANHLQQMQRGFEFGDISNTKLKGISNIISKELESYGDDGMRKIEKYIDFADFAKTEPLQMVGSLASGKRSVDRKIMRELGMTDDMVTTANKFVQQNRIASMILQEAETKSFNIHRFQKLQADGVYIPDDLLVNMGVKGKIGDLGANYRPLIPTEEYATELKKMNFSEWQLMDKHFKGDSHGFKKRRKWESDLSQNPELRMNLADTNRKYISAVSRNSSKHTQEQLIVEGANLEAFYGHLLTGGGKIATSKADQVAAMERAQSYFKPIWDEVQLLHAPPLKSRETLVGKAFFGWLDLEKTFAIARPNQAIHNSLQPFVTTTNIPFSKLLVEYSKQAPKFMKNMLVNVSNYGDIDNVMKSHTKHLDPNSTLGYNTRRYFSDMGNLNLSTEKVLQTPELDQLVGKTLGRKIMDMATWLFRGSDLMARSVLFTSANNHFEAGIKKFGHLKGKDNIQYLMKMRDHLGLDAIHANDIGVDDLMRKLLHSDIKEPAYLFSKITTNHALFDYRPMAKPMFTKRGRQSEIHSAATVFTSWGLYNTNVIKSYAQAASRGNYKPLMGLGAMASLWYYGMSELADSDNYLVSSFGRKGVSRTPGVSAVLGPYEFASRPLGGMLVNPLSVLTEGFVKPLSWMNNSASKIDKFDFLARELGKTRSPIMGNFKEIKNVYDEMDLKF